MGEIPALDPEVDHIRGPADARVILEYGDFECPYSRRAFREINRVGVALDGQIQFAFRYFPLTEIHPHAWAAATAAEAAALQGKFWEMYDVLFPNQAHLEEDDLRRYAAELDLDLARFEEDRAGEAVRTRIARDIESGLASGDVQGTPTLFIDGSLYEGPYDSRTLIELLGETVEGRSWP
jgi:protein-disulfide isomerase